jgi:hypothetical protein
MLRRLLLPFIAGMFLVASGCHVSRQSVYPEFIARKQTLGDLTILTDCMILQAIPGDTDKIDVVENKDIGVTTLEAFSADLREKGYSVRQSTLSSIGLLMNHNKPYYVAGTVYDTRLNVEDLPVSTPPFYLDPLAERDSTFRLALAYLYTSVLNIGQKVEGVKTFVPYAVPVGKKVDTRTIAVLLTGGRSVSLYKQEQRETANPNRGTQVVAVKPITRLSMVLYILDTATGEVIWEDRIFKNGGLASKERIIDMLADIMRDLP